MSLKQMMKDDMHIFYDVDEFGESATYKDKEIFIRFEKDYEVETISNKVISTPTNGVLDIKSGDKLLIGGINYKCINFDHVESFKSIIVISKI